MQLNHLSILNFKNIRQADLTFSPKANLILGMNGEGKTNLLDAIHLLSLCKSAIGTPDNLLINHDEQLAILQGSYTHDDGTPETIHLGLRRGAPKTLRRGAKPYRRLAEHIGLIPLVIVTPADQQLISGTSEDRRRFLDLVISQYNRPYLESLLRYNKALQQRNTLLRQPAEPDPALLSLWEEQMSSQAQYIYETRTRFVQDLIPHFDRIHRLLTQNNEPATLTYQSHLQRQPLLPQLIDSRSRDRALGYTLHGIHRDDLVMNLNGHPIRREGSQGQNKTYLLALKLAQWHHLQQAAHTTPILLLDDIFDKLDAQRVEHIVRHVTAPPYRQIFITDTNRQDILHLVSPLTQPCAVFNVTQGEITAEDQTL